MFPFLFSLLFHNRKIEEKRGVTLTESGMPKVKTTSTCPPVDLEWPPWASSSGMTSKVVDGHEKQKPNTGSSSTSSFDDIDPFADWPPRPGGSSNVSGSSNNGIMAS